MDDRYETYCAVDPLFYDSLSNPDAPARRYAAEREAPEDWRCEPNEDWLVYAADGEQLPPQGWKIHVSACLDNAERVLAAVFDYCVPRRLSFKHLRGPQMLLMRNAKYARRGNSGKFITIYPRDEAEFEAVCRDLSELLAGEPGPYILSDLRYGSGPVYVRYGGFAARYCLSDEGRVVLAIADGEGMLVPDRRDPVFYLPDWVTLPEFLAPHLAARNAVTTTEVPYRIERVLHFSNGGGLYVARDTRTDEAVVLKEGRPLSGLDAMGVDAITRLRHERDILRELADVPGVVRVHDHFVLGDHEFLALDQIDGNPLNRVLVQRYPLIHADSTEQQRAEFTAWALDIIAQVERAVRAIHERGIVYGDLHLFNVMVGEDNRVTLLDFEVARREGDLRLPALRNQAFAAPADRVGPAVDEYALACLRLALFLPLTSMLRLGEGKAAHLAAIIAGQFPVPASYLAEAVRVIEGEHVESPRYEPEPAALTRAILASATPRRDDRLFPGDIEQFAHGGLNLAYGASGVLLALSDSGTGRYPEHENWLLERVRQPESGSGIGFYDGLHGVAYALDRLGYRAEALDLIELCLGEPWRKLSDDLVSGLAGVGLNLAHFAALTGDAALRDAARQVTERLAERLDDAPPPATISGGNHPYVGFARGATGPALLFLRLYEQTGDTGLLDRAAAALRRDLCACVVRADGAMEVDEDWRTMPYLAHGSVGIGVVLDQYLRHRDDDQFRAASASIRLAARSPFYAQSGLFAGRAGIVMYLASRLAGAGGTVDPASDAEELARQVRGLAWHALPYGGGVAFPGEQLLRLSMDLATGTAGVLLALAAATRPGEVTMPFLAPLPPVAASPDAGPSAAPVPAQPDTSTADGTASGADGLVGAAVTGGGDLPATDFRRAEEQ